MSFGPLALWGATLVIVLLTCASLWAAVRVTRAHGEPARRVLVPWLIAVGTFAIVCGATWQVVAESATSHAFWDQWEEASGLFKPYASGAYTWSDLLAPHNEHRIALSRLWALLFFEVDGLWDNRILAAANALVHALPAALLLGLFARKLSLGELVVLGLLVIVPWALPLAWENVPYGFQSQFYFLILYGLLAIWLTAHSEAGTTGFWLGVACALLALFSVGSGPLCALAILLTTALEQLRNRSLPRERLVLVASSLIIALLGLATRVEVEANRVLRPDSFGELIEATLCFAGFPAREEPAMAFVVWSPALVWGLALLRRKGTWSGDERFLATFALFVLLHAPAIALTRGGFSLDPSSRYFDILSLGLVVNGLAALSMLRRGSRERWRWALLASWIVAAGWGIQDRAAESIERQLPGVAARGKEQERRLRGYLQTGDPQYLAAAPRLHIPFPDPAYLQAQLDDAFVRSILPWSLRRRQASAEASVDAGARGAATGHLAHMGEPLLIGGALCWGLAAVLLWRTRRPPG